MVKEGQAAPEFSLKGIDENGREREYTLKGLRGHKVVLYFYPKDDTPGCTTEACDFRDNLGRLKTAGVVVLGASPDSLDSHKRFHKAHGLRFPLLSDPDKSVARTYGAYGEKKSFGKVTVGIIRSTFLIDEQGVLKKSWHNVNVAGHVAEVLEAVKG